jgi:NitT/TauT family transport system permease protein
MTQAVLPDPASLSDVQLGHETKWRRTIRKASPMLQLERLAVLVLLIVIWNLAVKEGWINHVYSATARQTFRQLGHLLTESLFWSDLGVTLREALEGWVVGAALGLTVGLLLGRSLHAHRLFGPFLTFFNAIPKIALAPLFILWFGVGEQSKVVVAILAVFFIVQVPTTAAVALVNPDLDTVATTMGANQFQRFVHIYLPGVLSAVFGALRLGAVIALLTVVFTEFLAAQRGLGQRLIASTNNFDMKTAFAIMIVLACLALAINGAVGLLERRLMRWKDASSSSGSVISL